MVWIVGTDSVLDFRVSGHFASNIIYIVLYVSISDGGVAQRNVNFEHCETVCIYPYIAICIVFLHRVFVCFIERLFLLESQR